MPSLDPISPTTPTESKEEEKAISEQESSEEEAQGFRVARSAFECVPGIFSAVPRICGAGLAADALDAFVLEPALQRVATKAQKDWFPKLNSFLENKVPEKSSKSGKTVRDKAQQRAEKKLLRSQSQDRLLAQTEQQNILMASVAEPDMEPDAIGLLTPRAELIRNAAPARPVNEEYKNGDRMNLSQTRASLMNDNYRPIYNKGFTSWEWPMPRQEQTDRLVFKLGFENQELKHQAQLREDRMFVRDIQETRADVQRAPRSLEY